MAKTNQNLELFRTDLRQELSILESRKNNLAGIRLLSGRLQSKIYSTTDWPVPKSRLRCRLQDLSKSWFLFERDHRKISSLTIELFQLIFGSMDTSRNQDKAKKAEVSSAVLTPFLCQCHPSWVPPLKSTVLLKGE